MSNRDLLRGTPKSFTDLTRWQIPLLRFPRETERRMCVICEKLFSEQRQQESVVALSNPLPAASITSPPIQSLETPSGLPGKVDVVGNSNVLSDQAYENLARQLVRLTDVLGQHDTGSKEYDKHLGQITTVVEAMSIMRK